MEKKKKLEEFELDGHVRTLTDAHRIASDPNIMKQVQKHAKKKKSELHKISKFSSHAEEEAAESPEMHAMESEADEKKEAKSIDDIRARKKKIKSKMYKVE